jgi:isocitrate dehydrogenase
MSTAKIIYTITDEAPALATYSLLPIVQAMGKKADIAVERSDISLAGRIISSFPKHLTPEQQQKDALAELGVLCTQPEANVIKLPNISASIPQLVAAIDELRSKGFDVPQYVAEPKSDKEKIIKERYGKVLGSAVNPVLREGNSDRRVAGPVKAYAQKNPHTMGLWSRACKSHVAHMNKGDFFESEISHRMEAAGSVKIEHVASDGTVTVMKDLFPLQENEIIDASFMSVKELRAFYEKEIDSALKDGMLASLHLKATMMKVSDPILFGHCVTVYFKDVWEKHGALFEKLGVNANNGLNDMYEKLQLVTEVERQQVLADVDAVYEKRPWLAMVNSAKGITNLHVPSDVIVDASMPCVVRDSGKMWNKDDALEDVKCIIPDRCYATMYQEIMMNCKQYGQFDVATMGNVSNVGLMAQKAQEYGSHDKTFEMKADGKMRVVSSDGATLMEHNVEKGDVWRMAQTKDAPIKDWVRLAVSRARNTGDKAIFWLNSKRGHDAQLIERVNLYLQDHDTKGLDISIMDPVHAMSETCDRARDGKNTISVTGNVLRDYLTDLFPIIELGTSAKMLSIVPLLGGGGLFETGAGGSAPKHVQQFVEEGHLRWDSLGEYLALAVSLEHLGETTSNDRAKKLANALNQAITRLLENRKSPGRKVNQLDNRASNFYICLYWAEFMAQVDPEYQTLANKLKDARGQIVEELKVSQGKPQDVGGYYQFDDAKASVVMRPSPTFNAILDGQW